MARKSGVRRFGCLPHTAPAANSRHGALTAWLSLPHNCHAAPLLTQPGKEGPWATYARMVTLRTPKHLTGLDYGMPSLTFQVGTRW